MTFRVVRLLVEAGANLNAIAMTDDGPVSVLTTAHGWDNQAIINYLLENGARFPADCPLCEIPEGQEDQYLLDPISLALDREDWEWASKELDRWSRFAEDGAAGELLVRA